MAVEGPGVAPFRATEPRALFQPERAISGALRDDIIAGAYWRTAPGEGAGLAIV